MHVADLTDALVTVIEGVFRAVGLSHWRLRRNWGLSNWWLHWRLGDWRLRRNNWRLSDWGLGRQRRLSD